MHIFFQYEGNRERLLDLHWTSEQMRLLDIIAQRDNLKQHSLEETEGCFNTIAAKDAEIDGLKTIVKQLKQMEEEKACTFHP